MRFTASTVLNILMLTKNKKKTLKKNISLKPLFSKKKPGKPLYNKLKYCRRCCMPETNAFQAFDEFGICNACRSTEQKMRIDGN